MTTIDSSNAAPVAIISQELLPILSQALPSVISYTLPSERVVQANAEGARILARHSSTLSEKFDVDDDANKDANHEGGASSSSCIASKNNGERDGGRGDSRILVAAPDGRGKDNGDDPNATVEETELFLKRVAASSYAHKSWTDMRRTLVYIRTEVRFYNEIAPLLLADRSGGATTTTLRKHLPAVHHADYDLGGLVPEDSPATDAEQPSPFQEGGDNNDWEVRKGRSLEGRGGHILLESLSPSHGYFQDSPITPTQSLSCLRAVAELHAAAWGNEPLLRTIGDRLSTAGGSYQLAFRNPKELQNMVASWEGFRERFAGLKDQEASVRILERDSVMRLGRRVYEMAEYVSGELTPSAGDEHATMVHGDFKAMNVFLPVEEKEGSGDAIMIDFSCAGIGYGMSDVAMHIVHAVLPRDLENGGEKRLVEGYLSALEDAMNRKLGAGGSEKDDESRWTYPREAATRHYRLACVDYLRFIMGRFWRSATPESFEKKRESKNTTLINRNLEAAMAFIEKVDGYLEEFERERRERGRPSRFD